MAKAFCIAMAAVGLFSLSFSSNTQASTVLANVGALARYEAVPQLTSIQYRRGRTVRVYRSYQRPRTYQSKPSYGRVYTGPGSGTGLGRPYTGPGSGTGLGRY